MSRPNQVFTSLMSGCSPAKRFVRMPAAFSGRRPAEKADLKLVLGVVRSALKKGNNFTDAMLAGYTAVLCSPEFIYLEEKPGRLDDYSLASRLSYFLWNSAPDEELRGIAARGE